ncbi:fas-binding factor 1 homolog [Aricia agestis]|uniref:fas-binding factor 1 homolog n=1 Tax=Aricia agestis TaxID=91739 RepID=UPI001C204497|nr:fas-binding factor 1 homolog [Aricia agestis]
MDKLGTDLGSDKKTKSVEKSKKSQFSLDDLLGTSESTLRKGTEVGTRSQEFDFDTILGKSESKNLVQLNKVSEKNVSKVEKAKEPPKKSKSNNDWLGIFKDKEQETAPDNIENEMPSWLVGSDTKKKNNETISTKKYIEEDNQEMEETEDVTQPDDENVKGNIKENTIPVQQKINIDLSHEDLTMESTALCLKQQEAQLMVALQLKAQDDKLASMQIRQMNSQRVQKEAALAQHEQLDAMLKKQAEHRRQMQNVISAHQERITQRIKALLGTADQEEGADFVDFTGNITETKDTPHSKEKKQLLQLVQSLQENHDKEIDLMETSYRRQLDFLEISYVQAEQRMKDESEKLVKFYTEKINWLEEHHNLYKKMTEDNLTSLVERHKNENEMLRQQHLENIKVLQEHHGALMENVKNATKQEQLLIKDSAGFSTNLQELLVNVKESNAKAEQFYDKIDLMTKNNQQDSERNIQMRETQITEMLHQLKADRESFEKEKTERREIEKTLEARIRQMTTMIEEESFSLRQKKMDFEFEKATFSKQTEFAKSLLKKQDEDLKTLKDEINKEYQEKISKLEEEKAKTIKDSALIAKEKASVQSLKTELEKTKAELQAQLDELAEERSKINREKQDIHIEEQRIHAKSRDLELLAKSAIDKQTQADKKYSEADFIQKKFEDRMRRIQEHVVSLNNREKQIAKEKVALSRERLSLHNERKEIEGRLQCSLCRSTQYNEQYVPQTFQFVHTPASRDYEKRTFTNIEQEMEEFMARVRPAVSLEDDKVEEVLPHTTEVNSNVLKDYMDPKFMMLRLDVQQVISNLDQNKSTSNKIENRE